MTQGISAMGNLAQPVSWPARPATAHSETGGAFTPFLTASTTQTTPASPAATPGGAADTSPPVQPVAGDVQRLLLEMQSLERSGGTSAGADTAASTTTGSSFTAQVVGSDAGYDSSYGYSVTDAAGNPVSGGVLFANVKDGGTATVSGVDPSHVGFFIIPNGANDNGGLTNGEAVTFKQVNGQWAAMDSANNVIGGSGTTVSASLSLSVSTTTISGGSATAGESAGGGGSQVRSDSSQHVGDAGWRGHYHHHDLAGDVQT